MNISSTTVGRGIAGAVSCLATVMLLLLFLSTPATASPYVFAPGVDASPTIDWLNPVRAASQLQAAKMTRLQAAQTTAGASAAMMDCFVGFSAGDDQSACSLTTITLDGGYDSYTGAATDNGGLTWSIVPGSGGGSFRQGGINVGASASNVQTNGTGPGNFSTASNGGQGPVIEYVPSGGFELVELALQTAGMQGCNPQFDTVRLFFYPELTPTLAEEADGTAVAAGDDAEICSGETYDVEIDMPVGIFGDDPNGAIPHYTYTVSDPSGQITGLPANGIGESIEFDAAFDDLTLVNTSGTAATATISVTVFFDIDNDNVVDANECEGPATTTTVTVFPQAQASLSVANGTNNTFCEDESAQFRVTGSPNATVTYQIDAGTGTFGADQTIALGASGTNGGTNGEAANLITVPLTGLGGGDPVRIQLTNVAYTAAPSCPRSLSFMRSVTVVDTPEGDLALTNAADADFCNGSNTNNQVFLTFSTTSGVGTYDLVIERNDGTNTQSYNRTVTTTAGTGASSSANFTLPFTGTSLAGQSVDFTLVSITEAGSTLSCGGAVAGTPVTVVEQPEPTLTFDVSDGSSTQTATVNNAINFTVCDGTAVTFTAGMLTPSLVAGDAGLVFLDVTGDTEGFFGADRVLTAADIATLGATLDIPNNATAQNIQLEFTPFFDTDGNGIFDGTECFQNQAFVNINILSAVTASVTTTPAAQMNTAPTNDLVTVCSGDDVDFMINTNITTSGTANVVVDNGPNQVVAIGANGIGTFTLTGVTGPRTFTLVDVIANGCTAEFNESIDVAVEAVPTGSVAVSDQDICLDGSSAVTYTATGGAGGQYRYFVEGQDPNGVSVYSLTLTGGSSVTVSPGQFDYDVPGTYQFILTRVENAAGLNCGTSYTIAPTATVVVEEEPLIVISSNPFMTNTPTSVNVSYATTASQTDFSNEICSGDNVTLVGTAGSNPTSASTGDQLFYLLTVVADETGTLTVNDQFLVPAMAGGSVLLNQSFTNVSATNPANVSFTAVPFYGPAGTTLAQANAGTDLCFNDSDLNFGFAVLPTPEADFGSNQTICFDDFAVIDFTGTPGAAVSVTVLSGTTNAVAGANPQGGGALQTAGDTDVITLDNTGSAFFTTGDMTSDLELRITQVTSVDGCVNTDILDVEVVVLPQNDAAFTGSTSFAACEGITSALAIAGTPGAMVSILENGQVRTTTLDASGVGTYTTQPLATGTTTAVIFDVSTTTTNQSGNPVVCNNGPVSGNITTVISTEEAPNGTITAVEPVCSGTELPQLTFTQTAGNQNGGETFDIVINGFTYSVTDGQTINPNPGTQTALTVYNLESITETTANSMGCTDATAGTISSATVVVEEIPAIVGTVTLDGNPTTITDASPNNTQTVCSDTEFGFAFAGTPASLMSAAGDPLAYRFELTNATGNVEVRFNDNPNTDAVLFNQDDSFTDAQFAAFVNASLPPGTDLINKSGAPATLSIRITPYYEVVPNANFMLNGGPGASNTCPGEPISFDIVVLNELDATFNSAPQTICEDGTATIDFLGTPDIEISFFDGSQIITVTTDANGMASYTTVALTQSTTFTITGFSTLPGAANACTRTVLNGDSQVVTVTPTPTLDVDAGSSDLEICNDGSTASIALTSNSANFSVTYNVDGGPAQTQTFNGMSGTLSIPGLTADATVTFTQVTTDPGAAPVCPATVNIPVDIDVRDLPDPVITNDGPVCATNTVGLIFTDNATDVTGPYTVVITGPAGATYTGTSTASNSFANGRVFTGVNSGDEVTRVDLSGDYSIVAVRDNGANPTAGCAPAANPAGLTTTTVVIDAEPALNAFVTGPAGVVGLSQGGINAFNTTVCNGESITVDFQSTNATSNSGNPLRGEFINVTDPAGVLSGYLPAENATLSLADLDFIQALGTAGTVSFEVVPFYDADGDDLRGATECAGRSISFNITVLPAITAAITSPAAGTEVCDGETVDFTVTGTPGAMVTFSTVDLVGLNVTSPATIPASGELTISGTADLTANGFATLALSEVTLVTMANGANTTCSRAIVSDLDVTINALPAGTIGTAANLPLCDGESFDLEFNTNSGDGDYDLVINGSTYSASVVNGSATLTPSLTPTATTQYTLTSVTDDNGCMTTGTLSAITVVVNDVPAGTVTATGNNVVTTATTAGATATVCTGDALALDAKFATGVATPANAANFVSVAYSGDGDYFGQGNTSGTVAIPVGDFATTFSATFQNLTNATQNASLVVTYYFEENGSATTGIDAGECVGETVTLSIDILPNPVAIDIDETICSRDAVDIDLTSAVTNGVTGVSFSYTVIPTNTPFGASGTVAAGDNLEMVASMLVNTSNTDDVIIFTITPATGGAQGCTGNDFTLTLTVQPTPVLSTSLNADACSQDATGINLSTIGGTAAAGYNVVSITASDVSADFTPATGNAVVANGLASGALAGDAFTNTTSGNQTVTYAVAPVAANGCIGDTVDVVATIFPEPKVMNLSDTVCSGVRLNVDVIQDLVLNQVGANSTVTVSRSRLIGVQNFFVIDGNNDQVTFSNGTQTNPASENLPVIADSLVNLTNGGINVVYNITVDNPQNCGANAFTYTLRVVPEAEATLNPVNTSSFCTGDDITLNTGFTGGSAPTNLQYVYSVLSADPGVQVTLAPSGSSVVVSGQPTTASGDAIIAVTVSDAATGCIASAVQEVTIGVTPADNPISGPAQPCVNDFSNYTVRDRGNSYSFALSNPSAGQVFMNGIDTAFTVQFNSNAGQGPFILTMTETSPNGCVNTEELTISLVTQASADFFFQLNAGGVPRQVAFTNNSAGNPTAFSWEFGANGQFGTSTEEDPTVQFPDNPTNPGEPYDVDVTLTVTGTCAPNVTTITKTVTVNGISVCDDVPLVPGINFITFNVEPNDSLATTVFANVPGLVQVVGYENGLPQVFVPGNGSANSLDTIRKGAGYVVIVNTGSTLQACGVPIDPAFKRPLSPGVNYVGYMGNTPVSSDAYFASLNTNPTVDFLVAQTFGNDLPNFAEVYVPGNGNANFQAMRPGRGYLIIVDGAVPVYRGAVAPTESFDFIYGTVSGDGFVAGSTVDVLNSQGELVGVLTTDENGNFRATPLFGEVGRADGSFAEGMPAGEALSFRYNGEILRQGVAFNGTMAVQEVNLTFSQAPVFVEAPETLSLVLSPNPVGGNATVTVLNNEAGAQLEVLLMDANGRIVTRLFRSADTPVGETRIRWTNTSDLAPGFYSLIVLRDGLLVKEATTRMVKQ